MIIEKRVDNIMMSDKLKEMIPVEIRRVAVPIIRIFNNNSNGIYLRSGFKQ